MRAIGEFGDGRTIGHISKAIIRPLLMSPPPPQLFTVQVLNARNLVRVDEGCENNVFVQLRVCHCCDEQLLLWVCCFDALLTVCDDLDDLICG
jgi:hypothetical protein